MTGDAREIVKEGRVTATYPERHSARVEFEDKDGLISAELPVLTPYAWQNKSYALPDVGEIVVVLFATNADQTGTGWIIGSRFHDNSPPNANSQDKTRIDFADGTFIEYDRASHELNISCVGEIKIKGEKIYLN
ncbi:MAG: phage baseplate assembly protein V [Selenomonadaceae bacterium]|nr:phage baseplate assembly protein V [Selenomonadaceae bacterium]